ncbi:MAG: DUF4337 domain-containing protein [Bosea sp. (in: a-proteobacteria)]
MSSVPDPTEISGASKRIALLIAILALMLAFSEIGGKQAENESLSKNIEASNLWSFFQAKTIRRADAIVAAEAMAAQMAAVTDPAAKAIMQKQVETWRANAVRLDTEPETNEGRRELMARAKAAETERDFSKHRNEKYEMASGVLQIAIVISSASIITGIGLLAGGGVALGVLAVGLMALAQFAPLALF